MRHVWQIAKRELDSYLVSPIAYVSAAVFLAVFGAMFALILFFSREATLRYVFDHGVALLFFVLVTQVLTMRLLSDEARQGTLELLLTAPVRDWEIVVGKYLGALALLFVTLVLAGFMAVVLLLIGNPDVGPMLTGYLGYFLLGAALLAVGEFASSLT
ncbi:MAG: ABC transporter permease subunit, partial [Anaerolineae bacterium]